jgi:hypothetical protein
VKDDLGKKSLQPSTQLGTPYMATIMILDDDHGGIFGFEDSEAEIVESVGVYELKVQRISGARGKVSRLFFNINCFCCFLYYSCKLYVSKIYVQMYNVHL